VCRNRQQANITVVITITRIEVVTDGKKTAVLTRSTRKRLESAGIEASDVAEHALKLRDHLMITLNLILGDEGMNVLELRPEDGTHASSRVELHSAAAKRSHALVEAKILVGKMLDVTHHLTLAVIAVESGMSQESSATTILLGDLSKFLSALSSGASINLAAASATAGLLEGIKDISNILVANSLIKREAHSAVDSTAAWATLDKTKVDHMILAGVLDDLLGSFEARHADDDSIEESAREEIEASSLEHSSKASSALVDEGGDASDTLRTMIHAVESSNLAHKGRSSANVGSCTLTTDVLLTSAESHTVSLLAGLITSDTDDTARHDALQLVRSSKESSVSTTEAHARAKTSTGTNDDISTERRRLLQESKREEVTITDEETTSLVDTVNNRLEVINSTESVRITSNETNEARESSGVKGERIDLDDVDTKRCSTSLDNVNDVPVECVGNSDGSIATNRARTVLVGHAHTHGLSSSGTLIEKRASGDSHASKIADDSLIGKHGLKTTLSDLSLVGSVRSVPGRVLEHVTSDDRGSDAIVEALTDVSAVLVSSVLISDSTQLVQCLELTETIASSWDVANTSLDVLGNDEAGEIIQRRQILLCSLGDGLQHVGGVLLRSNTDVTFIEAVAIARAARGGAAHGTERCIATVFASKTQHDQDNNNKEEKSCTLCDCVCVCVVLILRLMPREVFLLITQRRIIERNNKRK